MQRKGAVKSKREVMMASTKKNTKKQDEKHLKLLRELCSLSHNKKCFDCGQRGPTYVNMTIGSFVCTSCSGILRGLNPQHRVKSISMTSFTTTEIEFLQNAGNEFCRRSWLGLWNSPNPPEPESRDELKVKDFMMQKYDRKAWYIPPSQLPPAAKTEISNNLPERKPLKHLLGENAPAVVVNREAQPVVRPARRPSGGVTIPQPSNPSPAKQPVSDLLGDLGGDPFAQPAAPAGFNAFGGSPLVQTQSSGFDAFGSPQPLQQPQQHHQQQQHQQQQFGGFDAFSSNPQQQPGGFNAFGGTQFQQQQQQQPQSFNAFSGQPQQQQLPPVQQQQQLPPVQQQQQLPPVQQQQQLPPIQQQQPATIQQHHQQQHAQQQQLGGFSPFGSNTSPPKQQQAGNFNAFGSTQSQQPVTKQSSFGAFASQQPASSVGSSFDAFGSFSSSSVSQQTKTTTALGGFGPMVSASASGAPSSGSAAPSVGDRYAALSDLDSIFSVQPTSNVGQGSAFSSSHTSNTSLGMSSGMSGMSSSGSSGMSAGSSSIMSSSMSSGPNPFASVGGTGSAISSQSQSNPFQSSSGGMLQANGFPGGNTGFGSNPSAVSSAQNLNFASAGVTAMAANQFSKMGGNQPGLFGSPGGTSAMQSSGYSAGQGQFGTGMSGQPGGGQFGGSQFGSVQLISAQSGVAQPGGGQLGGGGQFGGGQFGGGQFGGAQFGGAQIGAGQLQQQQQLQLQQQQSFGGMSAGLPNSSQFGQTAQQQQQQQFQGGWQQKQQSNPFMGGGLPAQRQSTNPFM